MIDITKEKAQDRIIAAMESGELTELDLDAFNYFSQLVEKELIAEDQGIFFAAGAELRRSVLKISRIVGLEVKNG